MAPLEHIFSLVSLWKDAGVDQWQRNDASCWCRVVRSLWRRHHSSSQTKVLHRRHAVVTVHWRLCFVFAPTNSLTVQDLDYVFMYVCNNIYVRAELYSLDCHVGAMKMYHCAWENTTDFSWAQNYVSDSDGSRTVSGICVLRSFSEFSPSTTVIVLI